MGIKIIILILYNSIVIKLLVIHAYSAILIYLLVDLDECFYDKYTCDSNADCTNTNGSYTCTCKDDYYGDGKTCEIRLGSYYICEVGLVKYMDLFK